MLSDVIDHSPFIILPVPRPNRLPDLELVGYLHRWVIQKSDDCNIYIHNFLSADLPYYHDHPFDFKAIVLSGRYIETTPHGLYAFGANGNNINNKKAEDLHYISYVAPYTWTMLITGPRIREWGFIGQQDSDDTSKWVPHYEFDEAHNRGIEVITRNGYEQVRFNNE